MCKEAPGHDSSQRRIRQREATAASGTSIRWDTGHSWSSPGRPGLTLYHLSLISESVSCLSSSHRAASKLLDQARLMTLNHLRPHFEYKISHSYMVAYLDSAPFWSILHFSSIEFFTAECRLSALFIFVKWILRSYYSIILIGVQTRGLKLKFLYLQSSNHYKGFLKLYFHQWSINLITIKLFNVAKYIYVFKDRVWYTSISISTYLIHFF